MIANRHAARFDKLSPMWFRCWPARAQVGLDPREQPVLRGKSGLSTLGADAAASGVDGWSQCNHGIITTASPAADLTSIFGW